MPANRPTSRTAETEAKYILERDGYQVIRTGNPAPFDLIAWKSPGEFLCLVVRRSKSVNATGHSETISPITELVRTGRAPGKCEFWVKYPSLWKRFEILPGGSLLKEEGKNVRDQVCS
jgi:hypothetical protein